MSHVRSTVTQALLFCLSLLAVTGSSAVFAADRAPVLLRDSMLLPPAEAVGTGATPEVKVRVELDARGVPSSVEVVDIDPSSDLDEAFVRVTQKEILTWRYAPAVENGRAVPATLQWSVQFQSSETPSFDEESSALTQLDQLDQQFRRRDAARKLPLEKQKKILLDYARAAEQFIDPSLRQQADTPRFAVITDLDAENAAQIIANNLEVSTHVLGSLYESSLSAHPHGLKTLVYVYSSRRALSQMRTELLKISFDRAAYLPPGFISATFENYSSEQAMAMLIHEASHAYSDHHLRAPGVEMPNWLEEGLAEYISNSEIKKGELIPGKTVRRRYVLDHFSGGARLATTGAGWSLDQVKKSIWSDRALPLSDLVATNRLTYYSQDSSLFYATSWLLVHFLRHGENGWADDEFPRLMLYLAEGYSADAAMETIYGQSLEEMDEVFVQYVKKF